MSIALSVARHRLRSLVNKGVTVEAARKVATRADPAMVHAIALTYPEVGDVTLRALISDTRFSAISASPTRRSHIRLRNPASRSSSTNI